MTDDVKITLEALDLSGTDVAVASLALEYAKTMDRAASIAGHAAKLEELLSETDDPDLYEQVRALARRVAAHAAVSDIGPKLLAALDSLHATPKSRAALPRPPQLPANSPLAALRALK